MENRDYCQPMNAYFFILKNTFPEKLTSSVKIFYLKMEDTLRRCGSVWFHKSISYFDSLVSEHENGIGPISACHD